MRSAPVAVRRAEPWPLEFRLNTNVPGVSVRRIYSGAAPGVSLWLADLDALQPQPALLSPAERARAARFAFDRDRHRYAAAHTLLREVLAQAVGDAAAAAALRIGEDAHGKPVLTDHPHTHFNLSHGAQWGLIGVAAQPIGVDIEAMHAVADLQDLARHHFTAQECAQIDAALPTQRDALFLTCWTRKEACLKAIGLGLSVAPQSFEAGVYALQQELRMAAGAEQAVALKVLPLALPVSAVASLAVVQNG